MIKRNSKLVPKQEDDFNFSFAEICMMLPLFTEAGHHALPSNYRTNLVRGCAAPPRVLCCLTVYIRRFFVL